MIFKAQCNALSSHAERTGAGSLCFFQDGGRGVLNVEIGRWIEKVMASKNEWKEDDQLEQDLKVYINQNLK